MKGGESQAHLELKRLAFGWAQENGFPLVGCEVRVPRSGYRADLAAASRHPLSESGRVALFECKQCRADLIRDRADEPAVRRRIEDLANRLRELRALIAVHRPDLRRGESLFAEFDEYDLGGLRHDGLHALERELGMLQSRLAHCVKFARLRRYHAADHLYLVTEPGILTISEIPVGWGWLVRDGERLVLSQPPVRHEMSEELRALWLEAIAVAGTRSARRLLKAASPLQGSPADSAGARSAVIG